MKNTTLNSDTHKLFENLKGSILTKISLLAIPKYLGGIGPGPFSNPNSRENHKISSKNVKVEVLKTGPN